MSRRTKYSRTSPTPSRLISVNSEELCHFSWNVFFLVLTLVSNVGLLNDSLKYPLTSLITVLPLLINYLINFSITIFHKFIHFHWNFNSRPGGESNKARNVCVAIVGRRWNQTSRFHQSLRKIIPDYSSTFFSIRATRVFFAKQMKWPDIFLYLIGLFFDKIVL